MSITQNRRPIRALLLSLFALFVVSNAYAHVPGRIEGYVKDNSGTPIANAQVMVIGGSIAAFTDGQGRYELVGVPAGRVDLRAVFTGYRPLIVRGVSVTGGRTLRQDFILEAATIDNSPIERSADEVRGIATQQATGDPRGRRTDVTVPSNGFQEATVTTGAAGAEYGNAQTGVLRIEGARPTRPAPGVGGTPTTPPPCCYRQEPVVGQPHNTEEYAHLRENGFRPTSSAPLSTFSIDVDKASYSNVRRFLTQGSLPPADAVRVEEMINYFSYDLPEPRSDHPFSVTTEVGQAPWARDHRLVRIGIQGQRLRSDRLPPNNLVFLIDVSGSMNPENKLPLVKRSLRYLVEQLREEDQVSIVVYAGAAGLVLPCTPGSEKTRILNAIDNLEAGGSTAGGAGIQLAYRIARENLLREGNNRVILATDGDFNVGPSSEGELVRIIEQERRSGVFLTVLGFGTGNYADQRMESLADKGNGNYFYVDNAMEGRKVFIDELQGTLFTIAKDVKIQVEFNPAEVAAYRLVGYENRALRDEDFNNDSIDAGELGAGHTVTALYEVIPVGVRTNTRVPGVDPLRYQTPERRSTSQRGELLTVKLRYQRPEGSASRLIETAVRDNERGDSRVTPDFQFAAAVAEFGMLLRNSEFKGTSNARQVLELAREGLGEDRFGYRAEFVRLVQNWQAISGNRTEDVGVVD
jgi:Ca-activated chloride channel homolog